MVPTVVVDTRFSAWLEECEDEEAELMGCPDSLAAATAATYSTATHSLLRTARSHVDHAVEALTIVFSPESGSTPLQPVDLHVVSWQPPADGLVVVEVFGGMATWLEALLRNGLKVSKYIFCDNEPITRKVASHRLSLLQAAYPGQLLATACIDAFSTLPQDVRYIQEAHIQRLGPVDILIAGWECQGFSAVGLGKGLQNARSGLYKDLVQILTWLKTHNPECAYILENTPA